MALGEQERRAHRDTCALCALLSCLHKVKSKPTRKGVPVVSGDSMEDRVNRSIRITTRAGIAMTTEANVRSSKVVNVE